MPNKKTLSQPATDLINRYKKLNIVGKEVPCPYFNNRRAQIRGGLRVLIGKGSPEEIEEEATLLAFRDRTFLQEMTPPDIKQFLIDHSLGIECSGFVYHILEQQLLATKKKHLRSVLSFPYAKNPLRKLLTKLRPAENTGVKSLAHEKNSQEVTLHSVLPGDVIIMMGASKVGNPDHILLIDSVEYAKDVPTIIHYTHAIQWNSDGQYDHGVAEGIIRIKDILKTLPEQEWMETHGSNSKNETYELAQDSKSISLRRLKALA